MTAAGPRLVLATHNRHKLVELREILAPVVPGLAPEDVVGAADVGAEPPVEDGVTFAENALIKARALARATGVVALADDSGLCVDVLGGAPGVFSARWSGSHGDDHANLALLLAQLEDVPDEHRGAQFTCAAALVAPDGYEHVEVGVLRGRLARVARGRNGFGYDPVLVPDEQPAWATGPVTCAELSPQEKNAISHRGHAFRSLAPVVARVLASASG
ncbi:RdgB/HAM1 family non-canonical purine NTP pyrophosphatase [Actinotalea sp. Marseille-Q4924]|uniref:RdgB/HAM1 family non-canonical purine NTP pyrophosphatase n=1 Tax=Actinotalea sp. Marseille-Q4924 TaxID=2866571 RepID=UPI001CE41EE6|nr:RdgB/HAM1 family non-canonical purine NTP pyrophosphatase [Actinotalea sp. Marseille-Q4924]